MQERKLEGCWDEEVLYRLYHKFTMSGDECVSRMDTLLKRMSVKGFQETIYLIESIRFFGGRVEFVHSEDLDEDEVKEYSSFYSSDREVLGTYCHVDSWVTIPLDKHKGWKSVESTLRHELIHLLQDVLYEGERKNDRELGTICGKVSWSESLRTWFEEIKGEHPEEPICEIEAHILDTWKKSVRDWTEEIKRKTHLRENYYCPLS